MTSAPRPSKGRLLFNNTTFPAQNKSIIVLVNNCMLLNSIFISFSFNKIVHGYYDIVKASPDVLKYIKMTQLYRIKQVFAYTNPSFVSVCTNAMT